jgi:hypothetical protein
MRMVLTILVLASFLVLAAPLHADDEDDTSKGGIEASVGDEAAPHAESQPPTVPAAPDEGDEGTS